MPRIATGDQARTLARSAYADEQFSVPVKPALRAGLTMYELESGLVIDGGPKPLWFRGARAADALRLVISRLEGSRDIPAIASVTGLSVPLVKGIVGLLSAKGVLQEGADPEPLPVDTDSWCYVARGLSRTEAFANTVDAVNAMAKTRLQVVGSDLTARPLVQQVKKSPFLRQVDHSTGDGAAGDGAAGDETLVVLCLKGEAPIGTIPFQDVDVENLPILLVNRFGSRYFVGPYLEPGGRPCINCASTAIREAAWSPDSAEPSPWHVEAACALIVNDIMHTVGRFGRATDPSTVVEHDMARWISRPFVVSAAPGCQRCYPGAEEVPDSKTLRVVLDYEARVAIRPRRWFYPAQHRTHYEEPTLALQTHEPSEHAANDVKLSVASKSLLADPLGRSEQVGPADRAAALLHMTMGVRRIAEEDQPPDRWAASAGNLGAVTAYCLLREVAGVPDGAYRYDGPDHRLIALRVGIGQEALWDDYQCEPGPANPPAALIALVADLEKLGAKYGLKAHRLAWLDVGSTLGQMRAVGALIGLSVRPLSQWHDALWASGLGIDRRTQVVGAITAILGAGGSSAE